VSRIWLCLAAVLAAAACAGPPRSGDDDASGRRLELIGEALEVVAENPGRAAELLSGAGPGATLERVRLVAWLGALEATDADPGSWQQLAEDRLPADLRSRAQLGLARALVARSEIERATAVLENASPQAREDADAALLELDDGPWRPSAAARLAVNAPDRLRRFAPAEEASAVASLSVRSRLIRAAAWREAGQPSRGAAELRRLRAAGPDERRRRLELARCEVAAGNPRRAVAAVRGLPSSDPEVQLARGEAYRRQGWQRYPRSTARSSFVRCLEAARSGIPQDEADPELERALRRLVVECGTEVGRVDEAMASWWRMESIGWESAPREWLGRRLGVAAARAGTDRGELLQLASSLPNHERCLRFWTAQISDDRDRRLDELAAPGFADLYGLWARELTGRAPPDRVELGPPVEPGPRPPNVQWLMDRDAPSLAAAEWRRVRHLRGSWPAESLAEAALAVERGRQMEAISALRSGNPELGTVMMERAPANAVTAYLPLRWAETLREAAAETGVEPWLLAGVARQESAFTAHARSPRNALGVMQLLQGTARGHARALGLGSRPELRDPELNIRLGAMELARLLDRFGAVEPALAAYNAGETRVRRWWSLQPDRRLFTEMVPIQETYNYIRRVSYLSEAYRLVYADVWGRTP
jgi:soluble lytic murein transglycosylase